MLLTFVDIDRIQGEDEIVPRTFWGAVPPKGTVRLRIPVSNVVLLYYSGKHKCYGKADCKDVLLNIQKRHLRKEMDDIKYNFMIDDGGSIYEGRGWYTTTPVPTKYTPLTSKCITIAFVGDYSLEQPSQKMVTSVLKLISYGVARNVITKRHDFVTYRMDE
ncbi:peptidoglycan recognition protein 1-like [Macrosteles quadrilineatus]|uniref:peptidoglycan recognition protein 1-like n=1 Tax=Macrosteles quadrilineatus TaxID=74068 RepID=UPI0023E32D20|nr:peptidoglycan recognition protein 1-like [Macrosteles quadrilineatus]